MENFEEIIALIIKSLKDNTHKDKELYQKINAYCHTYDDNTDIRIITWKSNSNLPDPTEEKEFITLYDEYEEYEELGKIQDLFLKGLANDINTLMIDAGWIQLEDHLLYLHPNIEEEITIKILNPAHIIIIYQSEEYKTD